MRRYRRRNRRERRIFRRKIYAIILCLFVLFSLVYVCIKWMRNQKIGPVDITFPSNETSSEAVDSLYDPNALKKQHIAQVLQKAEKLVMSYDYEGAIELLRNDQYYHETLEMLELAEKYQKEKNQWPAWNKIETVTVLSFESLIADPAKAFQFGPHSAEYNKNNITVDEFRKILNYLYENDYVLVRMSDLMTFQMALKEDNTYGMTKKRGTLYLPEDKKPIIITQDDVNYYASMSGNGFATRLCLDYEGNVVAEYKDATGDVVTGAYDLIPILDAFVEEHPDFSYRGAKGVIALTGYEGVFGYRTQNPLDEDYEEMASAVSAIATALRENGWEFASHSYSHSHVKNISFEEFKADCDRWNKEVASLIGEVSIYIWPYGEDSDSIGEIGTWRSYSGAKYEYLKTLGFQYFCNIETTNSSWVQHTDNYLRMGRIDITGIRMYNDLKNGKNFLSFLFPVEKVLDLEARPSF